MTSKSLSNLSEPLFRAATVAVLCGRAWQHIAWDAPYRALLWNETLFGWFVRFCLGMSWDDYANNLTIGDTITQAIKVIGVLYALLALFVAFKRGPSRWLDRGLVAAAFGLGALALCDTIESSFRIGQLMEHGLMVSAPLVLRAWRLGRFERAWNTLRIALALTFVGHGLFAIGFYPVPGRFLDMTMALLRISEGNARWFLGAMGALDFLIALSLWGPQRVRRPFVAWASIWGFATAVARTATALGSIVLWDTLVQGLPETLVRLPHGLLPLALYWKLRRPPQ